jgi:GNAT superfamily N-acetyltransferase
VHSNIRPLLEKDIDVLCSVYAKAYATRTEEQWTLQTIKELLVFLYKKQPDLGFVAESDGRLIGAILGSIKPWWNGNHIILEEIFIDPDFQRKSVGSQLLKILCEKAHDMYAATHIEAMTFREAEFPKKWYFSRGFEEIKEWMPIEGVVTTVLGILRANEN